MGVNATALERRVPAQAGLLLDSTTIIAYLNGGESVSPVAAHIIDYWVKSGRNTAAISMITVMEVLVKPMQLQVGVVAARDFLTRFPNFIQCEVDMRVAIEAARLRAQYGFKPPDALIIATGVVRQVGHLVTNDARWMKKLDELQSGIQVLNLSEFA